MSKTYTEKDMLILYATIDERAHIHEDFPNYRRELVEKLQELFDVNLSQPRRNESLLYLFRSTAKTYLLAGMNPLFSYLDATATYVELREQTGDMGLSAYDTLRGITKTCELKQQQYQQLLFQLYALMWERSGKVVTSEDLKKVGFDTSKEPDIGDYWDAI